MQIGELFAQLGFQVDKKGLSDFQDGLRNVSNQLNNFKRIVAGSAFAVFMTQTARAATEMKNYARSTGMAVEDMQKWDIMAQQNGLSSEQFIATIHRLKDAKMSFLRGDSIPRSFHMLGINPNQDPNAILNQLSQKLKGKTEMQKQFYMNDMGIDPAMLRVLERAGDGLGLISENLILTKKAIDDLDALNSSISTLWFSIKQASKIIASYLAPALKVVVDFDY